MSSSKAPPPSVSPGTLQALWILHYIMAGLLLIPAVAWGIIGFSALEGHGFESMMFRIFAVVALSASAMNMFAGQGLQQRRPWAKGMVIAAGIVVLPVFPIGTAFGIFALVVASQLRPEDFE